jgi:geranylgeranylglycerol-phosphate geranylgeranyltransferase
MMGFAVVVGAALASPNVLGNFWVNLIYGFVTGFMLTAASMTINDYYDKQIDAINEPNRPIPSGLIQPKQALAFALILTAVGFATAILTNLLCLVIAVIAWIVAVTYATVGKRSGLPGNFLVSTCVAIPFIYGSATTINTISPNVIPFASIAFLSNTGREITKGIVDVQGDKTKNIQTLAVRYGEKKAAVAAILFYLSAVLLSPLPWLLNLVTVWYVPVVTITDVGLVASSGMLLMNYSRENAKKIKNLVLLWLLIALLAFIIGTLK